MTFTLDAETLSLDRLDPKRLYRDELDPDDELRRRLRAGEIVDPSNQLGARPARFKYDSSLDSINFNRDYAGPTSITYHWWGEPRNHRAGQPHGVLDWLRGVTGNRDSSAHYVATVITATREPVVYQIINDADVAWHAGHTHANANSIGIEMMPFDDLTPDWQRDALLELAAELGASLWARWPGLENVRYYGHQDWYNTACPGNYYPRLSAIHQRSKQLLPLHQSFGQFNKTGTPTTEDTMTPEQFNALMAKLDGLGESIRWPGTHEPRKTDGKGKLIQGEGWAFGQRRQIIELLAEQNQLLRQAIAAGAPTVPAGVSPLTITGGELRFNTQKD